MVVNFIIRQAGVNTPTVWLLLTRRCQLLKYLSCELQMELTGQSFNRDPTRPDLT